LNLRDLRMGGHPDEATVLALYAICVRLRPRAGGTRFDEAEVLQVLIESLKLSTVVPMMVK